MTYEELTTKIAEAIKPNGHQEITAQVLQDVLLEIVGMLQDVFWEISDRIDAEAAAAQEQAIKTAKAYTEDKVPTNVSQLSNDANYATKAQVQTAQNAAFSNAMSYTNAQVQNKGDWVGLTPIVSNGESVKTITIIANTFTEVEDAVSSLTVSVLADDPMAGKNVLEASTYALQFTTADTVGDFVFPTGWRFPEDVTIEPNTTYQVTAVNGLALIVGWPNS